MCQRVFIVGSGTKMRMGASEGVLPEVDPASSTAPKVVFSSPGKAREVKEKKGAIVLVGATGLL